MGGEGDEAGMWGEGADPCWRGQGTGEAAPLQCTGGTPAPLSPQYQRPKETKKETKKMDQLLCMSYIFN